MGFETAAYEGESANDFVIVTGMSGAGRTEAMHAFEDLGYFCIDNLPANLIPQLLSTARGACEKARKLAVVCDARNKDFFADLKGELEGLSAAGVAYRVVFLDADDDKLVARYKASRRRHPMCEEGMTIAQGIAAERALLFSLRNMAHDVIDTSGFCPCSCARRSATCSRASTSARAWPSPCTPSGSNTGRRLTPTW